MKPSPRAPGAASWLEYLDHRPVLVAVAGPNGAGKTTFCEAHLSASGLRCLNADVIARDLEVDPYEAARIAAALRAELVAQRESFIFETVFSDPVGDKLDFLRQAVQAGYAVVLCFIGVADSSTSAQRVAMRVSQGGHDVPAEKLVQRFPRTLANLAAAIRELPCVLVFDHDNLREPFRQAAVFVHGRPVELRPPLPEGLKRMA